MTTYKDTHDSLRTTFSDPPCIGTRYETYFDACELNHLDLFNGDLQTIEQLPEENLAGLSFQAPLSLSSSSSNSSSITPPQSAAHNSTVAPLPAMPGFPPGHWAPFREYPEPHYQQSLILSDPQSLMPSNLQSHIPSNHYGLGIGLPTHVPGLFGSAVDVVTDDDHKLDSFEKIYENEGADKAFHGAAFSFTPCTTGGTDGDDEAANEDANAYNKVLERCLRTRKDFTMSLKDIYAWVRDNSSKASPDPESKGWQNSVRHNLSMNGVSPTLCFMALPHLTDHIRVSRKHRHILARAPKKAAQAFGALQRMLSYTASSRLPNSGNQQRIKAIARIDTLRPSDRRLAEKAGRQHAMQASDTESSKRGQGRPRQRLIGILAISNTILTAVRTHTHLQCRRQRSTQCRPLIRHSHISILKIWLMVGKYHSHPPHRRLNLLLSLSRLVTVQCSQRLGNTRCDTSTLRMLGLSETTIRPAARTSPLQT